MSIDTLTFYHPLPVFGVALSHQWDDFRHDFRQLSTLIRAAYADISTTPGDHDLSGWALVELDFHNRFRIFYDKVNRQFKVQVNTGTVAIPIWTDALQIRRSDGRVIAAGTGGFQSLQGFYQLDPPSVTFKRSGPSGPSFPTRDLIEFLAPEFYLSGTSLGDPQLALTNPKQKQIVHFQDAVEFNVSHSFPDENFTYAVYDNDKKSITPNAVFAYRTGADFYLPRVASGKAILIW